MKWLFSIVTDTIVVEDYTNIKNIEFKMSEEEISSLKR